MRVYLGGTVNNSKWRDIVIPKLEIDYYNPVVSDWNENAYQQELYERKHADYCLYVLTPKMEGYYAIGEVMDDSYQRPDRTIYCYITDDDGDKFSRSQINSLELLGKRCEENGAIWLKNLEEIIEFLNSSKNLQLSMHNTQKMNDVFISYGRKHSKNFAFKLHDRLKELNYNVWFDQNDIPLGVDFQEQINEGITKAHNFIFIISPHSVRSEYCLREIVLAVKLKKRIIPVLHVYPTDDMAKMHPTIEKLNWIYFQEEINDFEVSFKGLIDLIESFKDYVHKHTFFLNQAIEWEKKSKATALLLTGTRRRTAEAWLRLEFENTQAPCMPPDLVSEFICTSKEIANEHQTDVFLCYSEDETDTPRKVFYSLMHKSITAWTKAKNVKAGYIYENEAKSGIEKATNFIYFISNKVLASKTCSKELNYAQKLNKRIIPFLIEDINKNQLPDSIRSLYLLEYTKEDEIKYHEVFNRLLQVIDNEKDYFTKHKELLVKALIWEQKKYTQAAILNGMELESALEWLKFNIDRKNYKPLPLHKKFITESNISRPTVFISYIRNESTAIATKLCNRLLEEGFDVWFDPDEETTITPQTNEGIIKADNFIFVLSSQSSEFEYCLKELELAINYKKRIIPVLFSSPNDSKFLLKFNKNFLISFQEDNSYFEESINKLIELLLHQADLTKKHTTLLSKAIEWDKMHRNESLLLIDSERRDAENWLKKTINNSKIPSIPTNLQCEFICESKKNAELSMTDFFFSYAREDDEIKNEFYKILNQNCLTSWIDTSDIKKGIRFGEAINNGIERADNFLFFISPYSINSKYCLLEIKHVVKFNKRIIPVLIRETDISTIPEEIRQIQFIDFTSIDFSKISVPEQYNNFTKYFSTILKLYEKDREYHYQHKLLLNQALNWEKQNRNQSILLKGHFLERVEIWLKTARERKEQKPIELIEQYIEESKQKSISLIPDVYISYHSDNSDFAKKLANELENHGKIVWFDHEYIPSDMDYLQELLNGIELSYNFLFILSTHSIKNQNAKKELRYAQKLGKRIIPLTYNKVADEELPTELAFLQKINFIPEEKHFNTSYSELLRTLDTDREYLQAHHKWHRLAKEWEESGKTTDKLLRGNEFQFADIWMADALEHHKSPAVTDTQKEFIEESRKGILAEIRAKKRIAFFKKVMFIGMIILFFVAIVFAYFAIQQRNAAEIERKNAIEQKEKAEKAEAEAVSARQEAITEKENALKSEKEAKEARNKAEEAKKTALEQKERAEISEKIAQQEKIKANELQKKAEISREEAEVQRKKAESEKIRANEEKLKAERLFSLSEARALAGKAIKILNDGDIETAKILALHAHYLNKENSGPTLIQEIFDALNLCLIKENKKNEITEAHKSGIRSIAVNIQKNLIASGGNDGIIHLWSKNNNKYEKLSTLINLYSNIIYLKFSPDGKNLFAGCANGTIKKWNCDNLKSISSTEETITDQISELRSMFVLPINGNQYFLCAASNFKLTIWKINNNQIEQFGEILTNMNNAVCMFILNNKLQIIAGGNDKELKIWESEILKAGFVSIKNIPVARKITALDINSNEKLIAIGTSSGYIEVRDLQNYSTITSMLAHKSIITTIAFSPNANQLASSSLDYTAKLWLFRKKGTEETIDLKTDSWIWSLSYLNDNMIVIVGENNKIEFWSTYLDILADELCKKIKKKLSSEEMKKYTQTELKYKSPNCVSY